ncbi:hypothetical protein X975_25011, partial [Stegodyphus mimosarum]
MTESQGTITNQVHRIAVKIPHIWKSSIALWLRQCEIQFDLAAITNDYTKFSHTAANLDTSTLPHVSDLILTPPETDKYLTLKNRLIAEFQNSEVQQICKLLSELRLGDKKT